MRGVFVDANESLAVIFERLEKPGDPKVLIHRNPEQPRQHFSEMEIEELTASIRDKGVLQPILVRPSPKTPGEYEIVAGERRWRAAQEAGLAVLPGLVRDMPDDRAF